MSQGPQVSQEGSFEKGLAVPGESKLEGPESLFGLCETQALLCKNRIGAPTLCSILLSAEISSMLLWASHEGSPSSLPLAQQVLRGTLFLNMEVPLALVAIYRSFLLCAIVQSPLTAIFFGGWGAI